MITRQAIQMAAGRLRGWVRVTPVISVARSTFGHAVDLKLEHLQHTGSFKPRGAFNRMLSHPIPPAGVVAASGGNHGLAVAYAAVNMDVPAEIFVPETASAVKLRRLHGYGVRVTQVGQQYADALAASRARADAVGALMVHAYDDADVQAGQGSIAVELAQHTRTITTVLVAVGGGGLLGGIATWYARTATKVVAVEPANAPTLATALAAGHPVDVEVSGVAADALGARQISALTLRTAADTGVKSVLVDDKSIMQTRQALWDELHLAVEPAGATALAALTSGAYQPAPDEHIAVIICGANTDPIDLVERQ
ncbi:serine/threonine dehydratase [Virgisporangium aurantiacum]|nr:serine/threonine dehydratase [Virgisporangium aurantiacum]